LQSEQSEGAAMAKRLEDPQGRSRNVVGRDFTLKELEAKSHLYETMINEKSQAVWEKAVVLRDLQGEIDKMSAESRRLLGKEGDLEKVAQLGADFTASKRSRKADLSEASLYQAMSLDLSEKVAEVRRQLDEGNARTARGDAFDAKAARQLRTFEFDLRRSMRVPAEEPSPPGRQHYDAYPIADGLSRPYGQFPVFQPSGEPGYARHYRPELPRAIEF
jgi:hypothetical protein